jgi:hypothetical protein
MNVHAIVYRVTRTKEGKNPVGDSPMAGFLVGVFPYIASIKVFVLSHFRPDAKTKKGVGVAL